MKKLAHLVLILTLAACGTGGIMAGRTYHAWDNFAQLGYQDTQLNETVYRVSYAGYGIPLAESDDYAMLRAAEIAAQRGFKYFKILSENQTSTSKNFVIPQASQTTGTLTRTGTNTARFKGTTTGGAINVTGDYPLSSLTIGLTNQSDDAVADANMLIKSLSAKYGIKL